MNKYLNDFPNLLAEFHPSKNDPNILETHTFGSHQKVWWVCPRGHEYQTMIRQRTSKGVGCPFCASKRVGPDNCLKVTAPKIAKEWDKESNSPLTAEEVTKFSNKKVWWKCSKGHQWQAAIASRTRGSGCPYCSGKHPSPENNLEFNYPDIAIEWHGTKNMPLKPSHLTARSQKKVWWLCKNKHAWEASVASRTRGAGCPYCAGRKASKSNNLCVEYPALAENWHPTENGDMKPEQFTAGSNMKIWWKCSNGHQWQSAIKTVTRGKGCPICRK